MRARVRSSLLWGAVGFFTVLVLAQGLRLVSDFPFGLAVSAGVALAAGVTVAAVAYLTEHRLTEKGRT